MTDRKTAIARTSILGISVNLLLAAVKVAAGVAASSVAIISEGVNNASDALTSVLTLVGTKLAGRHPDARHPFGYGRLEYLTALAIALLILVTGIEMLIGSVKQIFHPAALSVSYLSLAIVAVSAVVKFILGVYTISVGRKVDSSALEAVGIDCRNDSFVSAVTIVSVLVFLFSGFSIDAYAGIFTSALIIKSGADVLFSTISELIGRPGEKELAAKLYKMIRATEGVSNAADMMLHNYGPGAWSGSVNVELDHEMSVADVYAMLHKLQLKIMHEEHVTMVFGVYAVDNDHEEMREIRKVIADFVGRHEHVRSFHAVYFEPGTAKIYCDLIVDYVIRDWEALRREFLDYMKQSHPDNEIILTIETEYV